MAHYRKTERKAPSRRVVLDEPLKVAEIWANRSGQTLRISLSTYNGSKIADIRRFYTNADGHMQATRKGVAFGVRKLREIIEALQKAEERARELGLLDAERAR